MLEANEILQKGQETNKQFSKEVKATVKFTEKCLREKYAKLFLYHQKLGLPTL